MSGKSQAVAQLTTAVLDVVSMRSDSFVLASSGLIFNTLDPSLCLNVDILNKNSGSDKYTAELNSM